MKSLLQHLDCDTMVNYTTEGAIAAIEEGANPNEKDWLGRTALHHWVYQGPLSGVKVLLNAGANINVQDMFGDTPLHLTSEPNRLERFLFLVMRGADMHIENKKGITPIDLIGKSKDIVSANYVSTFCKKTKKKQLLFILASTDQIDAVNQLLPTLPINSIDEKGWTALHFAASAGQEQMGHYLIGKGADIHAKTLKGENCFDLLLKYVEKQGNLREDFQDLLKGATV